MDRTDEKLINIQKLLSEVREATFHEHNKKIGDKTIFQHWQNADSAITTLRTVIKLNSKHENNTTTKTGN